MQQVIDAAATRLEDRFQGQETVKGAVHLVIGRVYGRLNRSDEALRHLESAAELTARGGAPASTRADVESELSLVQEEAGRYDEAVRHAEEGIRLLGDSPEDAVRSDLEARRAFSLMRSGRLEEAKAAAARHVAMQDRLMGAGSFAAVKSRSLLASVHYNLSEYPEALEYQEPVFLACRENLGPDHGETLDAQNNFAIYLSYAKRYDEAIELARDLHERNRRVFGEDHPKAVTALWILAQAYLQRGDLEEALVSYREVTATFARTIGADHPKSMNARTTEAEILHRLGRSKEAVANFRIIFAAQRDRLGPTHNYTIQTLVVFAPALMALGLAEEARRITAASAAAFEEEEGPKRFPEGLVNKHLGIALAELGRDEEAEAALLRAHEIFVEVHGEQHSRTREAAKALAEFYDARSRPEDAARMHAAAEEK
jgi:tetratricopeptide (TPR) repeat protein